MSSDPRMNLPRHTEVTHGKRLARVLSRELRPTGKPGLNRVWYCIEYAVLGAAGQRYWGVVAPKTVPARNLQVNP